MESPESIPARGTDRMQSLRIAYEDARTGCKRRISVVRRILCTRCKGTGADRGDMFTCRGCDGRRTREHKQGLFTVQVQCRDCGGRGVYAESPCDSCDHGLSEETQAIQVSVPAGTVEGFELRCVGKGDEVFGGEPGHLMLTIEVDTIGVLVRRGDDVVLEIRIGGRHLLLGGTLEVITLDGPVKISVPRGVRDGATVTLAGRGHVRASTTVEGDPYRDLGRGDQIVIVRVPLEAARTRARLVVGTVVAVGLSALVTALAL